MGELGAWIVYEKERERYKDDYIYIFLIFIMWSVNV
jgi:hypothetical protein